jgi:hypothetical protein
MAFCGLPLSTTKAISSHARCARPSVSGQARPLFVPPRGEDIGPQAGGRVWESLGRREREKEGRIACRARLRSMARHPTWDVASQGHIEAARAADGKLADGPGRRAQGMLGRNKIRRCRWLARGRGGEEDDHQTNLGGIPACLPASLGAIPGDGSVGDGVTGWRSTWGRRRHNNNTTASQQRQRSTMDLASSCQIG